MGIAQAASGAQLCPGARAGWHQVQNLSGQLPYHREWWSYLSSIFHKKTFSVFLLSLLRTRPNKSNGTARSLELMIVKAKICLWWSEYCGLRSQKSWAVPTLSGKIAASKERTRRGGNRKGEWSKEACGTQLFFWSWAPIYHLRLRDHNRCVRRLTISK